MCKTNIHTDHNQHFHRGIQMSVAILIFIYLFYSKLVLCILTTQKLVTKNLDFSTNHQLYRNNRYKNEYVLYVKVVRLEDQNMSLTAANIMESFAEISRDVKSEFGKTGETVQCAQTTRSKTLALPLC